MVIIFIDDILYILIQMFRFMVHSFRKSKTQPNVWVLAVYTFGHKDLPTCEMWVNRLSASLSLEVGRPKNLLVCTVLDQR